MYEVAACKWAGNKAALSHRSALQEYGLADVKAELIEVTTTERRCKNPPVLLHRTIYLPSDHVRRLNGRPVTDVARSLFDAGAVVPYWTVYKAVEQAVRRGLTTRKELLGRLIEHGGRGRRGCAGLRKALDELHPDVELTDSDLETLMLRNVWNGRMPRPEVQYKVIVKGRRRRLDFAYPHIKMGIEADSWREHGGASGFEGDRERDAEFKAEGWLIQRFTWKKIRYEPEWVMQCILDAYNERMALFFGHDPA
jgi:very-short-patch-repair endonuclease